MCQVKNVYISENTIPITPITANILLIILLLNEIHTPTINNTADSIPIGFNKFIIPDIS